MPRPFDVNDLFALEGIGQGYGGSFSFAPDGHALAFVRLRALNTVMHFQRDFLIGNDRADVWVQEETGRDPVNLTEGKVAGSGWWAPQWSPDGRRLAMLSTRDGNVTLWVWERQSAKLQRVTERLVELRDYDRRPFLWLSDRLILCPFLAERGSMLANEADLEATPRIATAAWADAAKGERETASVLHSGLPIDLMERPQGELRVVDVESARTRKLVDASTSGWTLAPKGHAVAIARQAGIYVPRENESLPLRRITPTASLGTYVAEIHFLDGRPAIETRKVSNDIRPESLRWSPDGRELAFFGFMDSQGEPLKLFRVRAATGEVKILDLGDLDASPAGAGPPGIAWLSPGDLLVRAARRVGAAKPGPDARRDWWLISGDGRQYCLTSEFRTPPSELWPQPRHEKFVGLADGALWQLSPRQRRRIRLNRTLGEPVEEISWPKSIAWNDSAEGANPEGEYSDFIFTVRQPGAVQPYHLNLLSQAMTALAKPDSKASLSAFAPRTDSVVYSMVSDRGTAIWRSRMTSAAEILMDANTFLQKVSGGQIQSIDYRSQDGKPLKAWLILPPNYQPGLRYPVLTWVHAGFVAGPALPEYRELTHVGALNVHIPASYGYAILIPSMPVKTPGDVDDVMLGLPNGVLPAVERAVDLGFADTDRILLAGHSNGGYSTYGLIAQTSRFKAAVALAGASNLISLYGGFDARLRYTDQAHQNLTNVTRIESGQNNLGGPPWQDIARYLKNSPIFYVDRIQTPVMIVQGDLDFVPLQQGEEMFMSLYRLGKRAQFIRYWGEGHELNSPANIRDMWSRVLAWFDDLGDVSRDVDGQLMFEGQRVRSRGGAPAWTPEHFLKWQHDHDDQQGRQFEAAPGTH